MPSNARRSSAYSLKIVCSAFKSWRVRFELEGDRVRVCRLCSGYPPSERAKPDPEGKLDVHRAYAEVFGDPSLD